MEAFASYWKVITLYRAQKYSIFNALSGKMMLKMA